MIMTEGKRTIHFFACRLARSSDVAHSTRRAIPCRAFLSSPPNTLVLYPPSLINWFDFFFQNQSTIFRNAAILHGYTHPETYLLEDALSKHKGSPWEGVTDWRDFCRLCFPFRRRFHVQYPGA